ncbi:hypothetical protein Q6350_12935 [Isoptericola sp. b515]|uniref:hypothetical protein n=1 Tax=Isoptericola sp. b515 TaxID=3064652 RepID=UPI0027138BAE|nr:hypothetical protein [Isoptericola sp. b515]MDO8149335.1 hypothetical protein [Isoptericola sp. b515]
MTQHSTTEQPVRSSRAPVVRRWVAGAMVVITTLLVVASSLVVWAHRTVLDTDRFMDTVGPALDDPAFADALADRVSDEVLLALDLDARVSDRLAQLDTALVAALVARGDLAPGPLLDALSGDVDRPTLAAITPLIVEPLEERIDAAVERVVTSDAVADRVPDLVERAHSGVVALARADVEDHPNVYLTDDAVMLNTLPLVADAVRESLGGLEDVLGDVTLPDAVSERAPEARAQLSEALGVELPEGIGQVQLMDRATFDGLQDAVTTADRVGWLLVVLTLVAVVATLWISPDRRRGAVQLGIGVLVGVVIVTALISRLRGVVVDVARTPDGERVATVLFESVAGDVHEIFWLVAVVAAVTVVVGALLGRPRWLVDAGRRWPWVGTVTGQDGRLGRWVAAHADVLRLAVLAVAVLVVVATGFLWVVMVLTVLLAAAALWAITVTRRSAGLPGERRGSERPPAEQPPAGQPRG